MRLLDAGAIHPTHIVGSEQPFTLADVSIVIPAHVRNAKDARLLDTLVDKLTKLSTTAATIIVVNDASPHAIANIAGARVVSLDQNKGPGAARNHGLQFVTTPFVAFIDVDVTLENNALIELLSFFSDERVGLVAPRIVSAATEGALSAYEAVRSPLDLGPLEGLHVVVGDELHGLHQGQERLPVLGLPGDGEASHGSPGEAPHGGHELLPARVGPGEL